MTEPLVSVFMPTYHHAAFIDEAIQSVVDQDYPNLEVVVGDDGSTDGTAERVADWARRYPTRVVNASGPHLGIVANHNRVLRACRGKYMAHTSGDDVFLPGKVAAQVMLMESDDSLVMCGHHIEAFDSDTGRVLYSTMDTMKLTTGHGANQYVSKMQLFPGISTFLRRSAVPANGYSESAGIVSDFKFMADVLATGGRYAFIDRVLARYRVHQASISSQATTKAEVSRQYLDGYLAAFDQLESDHPELAAACAEGRARAFFAEARRTHKGGDRFNARRFYLRSITGRDPRMSLKAIAGLGMTLVS